MNILKLRGDPVLKFVEFTGAESEKEFLDKCIKQWELQSRSPVEALMQMANIIRAIRNRIKKL